MSNRLDSVVKTLIVINQNTLKNLEKEIVGDDTILKIVDEIETLTSEDENEEKDSIEDITKDFLYEFENYETL